MITAVLLTYAVLVTVWLLIALGGNADLAAENRRLRGDHLKLVHPSTRKTIR